jgi:uncharacterized membrane protein YphA (DoxX/SURF4 family)
MALNKTEKTISWIFQVVAAVILLQTLFFKFTGADESIRIFTTLGVEPWGRIGSGIVELAAGILLLIPSRVTVGALLALGTMTGAIFSHLTALGIDLSATGINDGGFLFSLAVTVFVSSLIILVIRRREIPGIRGSGTRQIV